MKLSLVSAELMTISPLISSSLNSKYPSIPGSFAGGRRYTRSG